MYAGQKSVRNGIEDFLCPFTIMNITQGANGALSHRGTMANDVAGSGGRDAYYAPCTSRCLRLYPDSGQSMWQSLYPVRFANGNINTATYMVAHDNTQNCYVGQVVNQGDPLGAMGDKGYATGIHCHIEIEQGSDTTWRKNEYGIWCFNNEVDTDDCYFVDNTQIINGMGGNWKVTSDVLVNEPNTEPITEPVTQPPTDAPTEPVTEPVTEPITEPITEPVTTPPTEPVTTPNIDDVEKQNIIIKIVELIIKLFKKIFG